MLIFVWEEENKINKRYEKYVLSRNKGEHTILLVENKKTINNLLKLENSISFIEYLRLSINTLELNEDFFNKDELKDMLFDNNWIIEAKMIECPKNYNKIIDMEMEYILIEQYNSKLHDMKNALKEAIEQLS